MTAVDTDDSGDFQKVGKELAAHAQTDDEACQRARKCVDPLISLKARQRGSGCRPLDCAASHLRSILRHLLIACVKRANKLNQNISSGGTDIPY